MANNFSDVSRYSWHDIHPLYRPFVEEYVPDTDEHYAVNAVDQPGVRVIFDCVWSKLNKFYQLNHLHWFWLRFQTYAGMWK